MGGEGADGAGQREWSPAPHPMSPWGGRDWEKARVVEEAVTDGRWAWPTPAVGNAGMAAVSRWKITLVKISSSDTCKIDLGFRCGFMSK
ncbi:small nuclear ribonucleoprotein E isoform X2 [Mesoplodon densirostris]|uniref:small nuclear ribonucleoprotein E isoform X2 n=1 Tax=Mesoplodon densirostris TaxID=48708 RepID=UPI0028DBA23A|nr:small nuclear ribonucleoprotein E isoform X2 [Mesoplodon densirostris]